VLLQEGWILLRLAQEEPVVPEGTQVGFRAKKGLKAYQGASLVGHERWQKQSGTGGRGTER